MSFLAIRTAVVCSVAALYAQERAVFSGDLFTVDGRASGVYSLELTNSTANLPVERTVSQGDGRFAFHSVLSGNYTIVVKTEGGDVVGLLSVSTAMGSLPLRIQVGERAKTKPGSGTVSAVTLQHHAPKKAVQEMNAAIKASHAGDAAGAQEHLHAALRIDPDFSEAHTNLGAEYVRGRQLELAYEEFTAALRTGPNGAMQHCNIAVAAQALRRPDEAEREARLALQADSRYPQANLMLGRILAERGNYDEAVRHLKLATEIPSASTLLNQIYARTGRPVDKTLSFR